MDVTLRPVTPDDLDRLERSPAPVDDPDDDVGIRRRDVRVRYDTAVDTRLRTGPA